MKARLRAMRPGESGDMVSGTERSLESYRFRSMEVKDQAGASATAVDRTVAPLPFLPPCGKWALPRALSGYRIVTGRRPVGPGNRH